MAPSKATSSWDDEDDSSTPPSSPPVIARRGKFEDEEEDSDVLESWDAAEDSEEEREKAKKAAEAKARADAVLKANHKSVKQKILEKQQQKQLEADDTSEDEDEEEDEATRLAAARQNEKESDLRNAEDLFGGVGGVPESRGAVKPVTVQEDDDPTKTIDLSSLKLFNPATQEQFKELRETLAPLLTANSKRPQYPVFMQELTKMLVKELNSEQVRKISTGLSTISNEKMKEEKASEKGGKKTKAAKTKASLSANRNVAHKADTTLYDDGLADDDFM